MQTPPKHELTKSSILEKLAWFRATTWFPRCTMLLDNMVLSIVAWLFKLSTSDAEDDGDSPAQINDFL